MADARQAAEAERLVVLIEDACGDRLRLGALRQEVEAAALDPQDRTDLSGRIDTYLGDLDTVDDPWDRYHRGDGPLPEPGTPTREVEPEDGAADPDAADALLDLEDGFTPIALPADG